ncbi:MAG: hypothetical protein QOI57_3052 [Rubrobacteraceae bacterium]|nr:hypothetical protein [Rubrobacteraceae bacterium]
MCKAHPALYSPNWREEDFEWLHRRSEVRIAMRVDEVQDMPIDSDERVLGENVLDDAAEGPGE